MTTVPPDPFADFVAELSDGQRWALLKTEGWDQFIERLSDLIVNLPARRRQALMMLLFALVYEQLTAENARAWLEEHDVDREDGIEAMIAWLRGFRPPQPPPDET